MRTYIPNFGIEAPNHIRVFRHPARAEGGTDTFTWVIDSNGIVWVSGESKHILESPCLSYCLDRIKAECGTKEAKRCLGLYMEVD
jgi:hypothetical protein